MNKEEGFTLVELLAVLAILAIIVAIAVPAVGNIITSSNTKASDAEQELIIDAARLYELDKETEINDKDGIPVSYLISEGYLELRDEKTLAGTVRRAKTTDATAATYIYDPKGTADDPVATDTPQ